MTALLLFSTLSFTLDMHFCGETLVDLGVFHKAEGCGMAMGDASMESMGCCSDVTFNIEGQDDLNSSWENSQGLPELLFEKVICSYVVLLEEDLENTYIPFKEYSPPLLIRDISLSQQRFLI